MNTSETIVLVPENVKQRFPDKVYLVEQVIRSLAPDIKEQSTLRDHIAGLDVFSLKNYIAYLEETFQNGQIMGAMFIELMGEFDKRGPYTIAHYCFEYVANAGLTYTVYPFTYILGNGYPNILLIRNSDQPTFQVDLTAILPDLREGTLVNDDIECLVEQVTLEEELEHLAVNIDTFRKFVRTNLPAEKQSLADLMFDRAEFENRWFGIKRKE